MDPVTMAMIAQAGMSYFGGRSQRRAQKRYQQYMEQLAAPTLKARSYLASQIGKESPLLAAAHRLNIQKIGQTEATQLSSSRGYFGRVGNPARGRGEAMRIKSGAMRLRNQASLGYASEQEQFGTRPAEILAGGSLAPAMEAGQGILGQGQATQDMLSDFSGILGSVTGYWQLKQLLDKYNFGGTAGMGGTGSKSNKW